MKPLTIEQLKVLPVQDWIYVIDKVIVSKEYKRILDKTDDKLFLPEPRRYKDYGTKWVAYKNKEMAEGKGEADYGDTNQAKIEVLEKLKERIYKAEHPYACVINELLSEEHKAILDELLAEVTGE